MLQLRHPLEIINTRGRSEEDLVINIGHEAKIPCSYTHLLQNILVAGSAHQWESQHKDIRPSVAQWSQSVVILLSYKQSTKNPESAFPPWSEVKKDGEHDLACSIPEAQIHGSSLRNHIGTEVIEHSGHVILQRITDERSRVKKPDRIGNRRQGTDSENNIRG